MGTGIAQLAASAGFNTIQYDVDIEMIRRSKMRSENGFQLLLEKGKITKEDKIQSLERLHFTTNIQDCKADIVIEAIIENMEAKLSLFKQLIPQNSPDTIFATNTSSLSVSALASALNASSRFIGMHFFNPAPVMKLVEIIKGNQTDSLIVHQVYELAKKLGKTPVICTDSPGFIVNRVARPYYLEAMKLVETGISDKETIDELMRSTGFKMGPFELMDLIGIDINYSVSNIVWEAFGKPTRLMPSELQKQKIENGELGRKTGKGFYTYKQDGGEGIIKE